MSVDRIAATTVVTLALLCVGLVAFAPTAAAQESGTYAVEQGDQCIDVDPIVDESQTVEEFYDYRNPYTNPDGRHYSSHGTVPYQEDNTSILMLYEGAEGTSLVVVHERYHENEEEGTNGSSVTFTVTGISPGDGWAVEDDNYDGQDDEFYHHDTSSEMNWVYAQGRTDGGAYRGLEGDFEVGIEPQFNEDANKRYDYGGYDGQIHDWKVVTATDDGFERVPLNSLDQQVTITPGHCDASAPVANLTVDDRTPEVGETSVTLDASGSESEAGVSEYRWDLTGDGQADRVTGEAVIEHVFEDTGERDVAVTVVDQHGQTDSDAVPVDVRDSTDPTARVDAPNSASTGETVTFDGAASEDNHRIDTYEWEFGDGATGAGETAEHAYEEAGTYEVRLRVVDESGNEDTATTTVEVEDGGPTAVIDAPHSATTGETVTFDGSDSSGDISHYEWDFGDGATGAGETAEHSYDEAGTYEVRLRVVDDSGNEDTATTTVEVEDGGPTAVLDAPATATVDEPVTLDASESAAEGDATYDWYADGTHLAHTDDPTHETSFEETGTHEVRVEVTDGNGRTDAAEATVEVERGLEAVPEANATTVEVGETVAFDGRNSTGDVVNYYWAFGDGTRAGEPTATHEYSRPGDYEVRLRVENSEGETASDTVVVTVQEASGDDDDGDGDDQSDSGGSGGYSGGGGWSGGSSSGSSSNGGALVSDDDEGGKASVEVDGDVAVVTASYVDAGEAVSADVPSESGEGFDPIALESVELRTAEDVDDLTVEFESAERSVPGRFTDTTAAEPSTTADLESVTYEFSIDREAMRAAGVTEENLTAYAHDGAWRAVETTTESDGDRVVVTATVEGEAAVAVGAEGPALYVTDVRTDGPVTDGAVDVEATVRNTGTAPADGNLTVAAGGDVAEVPVVLNESEERPVAATVPVPDEGAVAVRAGATRHDVAVLAGDELSVEPGEIGPGESVTVEAVVRNRGTAGGEYDVPLVLAGRVVATERVSLEPGEYAQVTYEQRVESPGSYEVAVGDATGTVRVEGDGDQDVPAATEDGAGFGAVAAVAALVAGLAALRRRR